MSEPRTARCEGSEFDGWLSTSDARAGYTVWPEDCSDTAAVALFIVDVTPGLTVNKALVRTPRGTLHLITFEEKHSGWHYHTGS